MATPRPEDRKDDQPEIETVERKDNDIEGVVDVDDDMKTGNVIADAEARKYANPNLVISEEESKRLRRRIHKR